MILRIAFIAMAMIWPARGGNSLNMVQNGDFQATDKDQPSFWRVVGDQSVAVESGSLCVKVVQHAGKNYGEIGQGIAVTPNTRYRIMGQIKGSTDRIAFFMVKLRRGREELERVSTGWNQGDWKTVVQTFNSGDADNVQVLCRFRQQEAQLGETAWFRDVSLVEAAGISKEATHPPRAVSTFNSIGLYWKPQEGSPENTCRVRYRKSGSSEWKEAMPLWFDPNDHEDLPEHTEEYRGSIVHLDPGTAWDIELHLQQSGTTRTLVAKTWPEQVKVKETRTLPFTAPITITEGGSADAGYIVYTSEKPLDAEDLCDVHIRIDAPFVILRGLTLKGAGKHGVHINSHHVVIEDCDISNWGRIAEDGYGENMHSAIYGNSPNLEHIVIQRCRLHHPRSHANSWNEERTISGDRRTKHPMGAQGITLVQGKGRYVIRRNRIESDPMHMFNDGMGEYKNFSFAGFPNRDSDIYENFVSHCCDDGLEIEGANMNVRVWRNATDVTMMSLAGASTSLGPAYFWRNISLRSRTGPGTDYHGYKGGGFFKLGNESTKWTGGRMYIFHNTICQPPSWPGMGDTSGTRFGLVLTSPTKKQRNILTRNNVLHGSHPKYNAIRDPSRHPSNDFDYDLYSGELDAREGVEPHGIKGAPEYHVHTDGRLALKPGTPGHDTGIRLPNFNDAFEGKGPDRGAFETGDPSPLPSTWPRLSERISPP